MNIEKSMEHENMKTFTLREHLKLCVSYSDLKNVFNVSLASEVAEGLNLHTYRDREWQTAQLCLKREFRSDLVPTLIY